ncbi:hypothetical protein ACU82A_11315 [Bacillus cereus]
MYKKKAQFRRIFFCEILFVYIISLQSFDKIKSTAYCEGGYPFFPFGRKGGDNMEFLFDLVKEFVKATVREVSAYFLRKQLLGKDNKKTHSAP